MECNGRRKNIEIGTSEVSDFGIGEEKMEIDCGDNKIVNGKVNGESGKKDKNGK